MGPILADISRRISKFRVRRTGGACREIERSRLPFQIWLGRPGERPSPGGPAPESTLAPRSTGLGTEGPCTDRISHRPWQRRTDWSSRTLFRMREVRPIGRCYVGSVRTPGSSWCGRKQGTPAMARLAAPATAFLRQHRPLRSRPLDGRGTGPRPGHHHPATLVEVAVLLHARMIVDALLQRLRAA